MMERDTLVAALRDGQCDPDMLTLAAEEIEYMSALSARLYEDRRKLVTMVNQLMVALATAHTLSPN